MLSPVAAHKVNGQLAGLPDQGARGAGAADALLAAEGAKRAVNDIAMTAAVKQYYLS